MVQRSGRPPAVPESPFDPASPALGNTQPQSTQTRRAKRTQTLTTSSAHRSQNTRRHSPPVAQITRRRSPPVAQSARRCSPPVTQSARRHSPPALLTEARSTDILPLLMDRLSALSAHKLILFSHETNKVLYPTRVSPESSVRRRGWPPRPPVLCVSVTGTVRTGRATETGRVARIWGQEGGEELRWVRGLFWGQRKYPGIRERSQ